MALKKKSAARQLREAAESTRKKPADWPAFKSYAWDRFDPALVLTLLTSSEQSYRFHKATLFYALCTWIVCPLDVQLRQMRIALSVFNIVETAERLGEAGGPSISGNLAGRLMFLKTDFYDDLYFPLNGVSLIRGSPTTEQYRQALTSKSGDIRSVASMMQVFHHVAIALLARRPLDPPSINKARVAVAEIDAARCVPYRVKRDTIEGRYDALKGSAALVYAASNIQIEGRTFLDLMIAGEVRYDLHRSFLNELVGKAEYAVEFILSKIIHIESYAINRETVPRVAAVEIPPPVFSDEEDNVISRILRSQNPRSIGKAGS